MKKVVLLLVLLAAIVAGGVHWYLHREAARGADHGFVLAPIEYGPITESISATGFLEPEEVVAVGSELSGRVVELYPGGEVNKVVLEGDPLLKLDDRSARGKLRQAESAVRTAEADLDRARAQEDAARVDLTRLESFAKNNVVNPEDVEKGKAQLRAAEATVQAARGRVEEAKAARDLARLGLDLTVVRVPEKEAYPGAAHKRRYTVLERKVVAGQLIGPPASAQLFTLAADLGRMQVRTQVSENDIARVRPGLSATFSVYGLPEETTDFRSSVSQVRPAPTSLHGAVFYDALLSVANQRDPQTREWKLRPGMTTSVDIVLRRREHTWKMPTAAFNWWPAENLQTEAARAKLARWQTRPDRDDWKPVWALDARGHPWPIFVRLSRRASGETGLKDGQFNEVLEWEPELSPRPTPNDPSSFPRVITGAPPPKQGLLDSPRIKVL